MTNEEMFDVLTAVAAGTGRDMGVQDVQLWQAVINPDVPKEFALRAIVAHFAERPGVWLEPGHVQQRWRDYRRDQLAREDEELRAARQAALDARNVADLGVAELAASKAVPTEKYFRRSQQPGGNPLTVACPWCKAMAGQHCHFPNSTEKTKNPHPSRMDALAATTKEAHA